MQVSKHGLPVEMTSRREEPPVFICRQQLYHLQLVAQISPFCLASQAAWSELLGRPLSSLHQYEISSIDAESS